MFYLCSYYYHHHHHYFYFVDGQLNVVIPGVLGYPCILYSIICSMVMLGRVGPFSIHPSRALTPLFGNGAGAFRIGKNSVVLIKIGKKYKVLCIEVFIVRLI